MNYVDANIILYALLEDSEKGRACLRLMDSEKLVTNTLSLDEVAFKISKKSKEDAVKAVKLLSNSPDIILVPFFSEDANQFCELLLEGFLPRDAIHALTAIKSGCNKIYSEDRDFDRLKEWGIKRTIPWKT